METVTDLIVIEAQPMNLSADFEQAKAMLEAELAKYDVVVTAETLADCRKWTTEINKIKGHIETLRKDKIRELSAPIKQLDDDMKNLSARCDKRRQELLDQIKTFEDETRKKVADLLTEYRTKLYADLGVREEFYRAEFDDLVKVTALTDKGNLKKMQRDELERRVRDDLMIQERTDKRILELKVISYEAGLSAPLTIDHVKPFLFDNDTFYASEVQRIIAAEKERQVQVEERLKAQMEQEKPAPQAPAATPEPTAEPAQQKTVQETAPAPKPPPPAAGKIGYDVHCVFSVDVNAGVKVEAIEAELRKVMEKAGITSLQSVKVIERQQEKAA